MGVVIVWPASVLRRVSLNWQRSDAQHTRYSVELGLGAIDFSCWRLTRLSESRLPVPWRGNSQPLSLRITPNRQGYPILWQNFGIRFPTWGRRSAGAGIAVTEASLPLWIPLLAVAVPTGIAFQRLARRCPGRCSTCGYDLTGNTSGVCPECGGTTRIPRDAKKHAVDCAN
jgi:hypothetical protein